MASKPNPFASLRTTSDWAKKLEELIDDAMSAVASGNEPAMKATAAMLARFARLVPRHTNDALWTVAVEAAENLAAEQVGLALERLRQRSIEIDDLRKLIDAVAAENRPE